ncbi:MAG: ATP-binding cassette domain-containing protein [Faecousia sp.]
MGLLSKRIDKQIAAYQRELIETHYAEVDNMYHQIRGWRHDYRNHIQTMKAYAAAGDWASLTRYLDELETDLATVDTVIKTGNPMTDAILNSKISLAHSKGIQVSADAQIPVRLKISEIDLCCIIGNLFDNAIEASSKLPEEQRLIRVYMDMKGTQLYIDIRKYRYDDYMNIFSVVFRDFQLLSQPLGANVAGSGRYDRQRVIKALEDAGFGERLNELPQGLDTCLYRDFAEEGVEVSGGEAQKIAIARALYKDAPFIILDEPTAALDPIAEAEIYSKFNSIVGDKTAIYISHRLSSCKFCDEIAVFQDGSIVQQGTHEALLAQKSGQYARLWNAQAQYYQTNE